MNWSRTRKEETDIVDAAQYIISKNNRRSDKPLMGMSVWKEIDKTRR